MARVACTHPVNSLGAMQGGGVLCSWVALDPFMFWRIRVRVDICRFRTSPRPTYVCGKETSAGPNRFESPLLLGEGDSTVLPYIVVN